MPIDITYGEFVLEQKSFTQYDPLIHEEFDVTDDTPLSDILDIILNIMVKEDFIFSERYKVVDTFDSPHGKWPNMIKDSIFIDCKMFHIIYSNKISARILEVMEREATG